MNAIRDELGMYTDEALPALGIDPDLPAEWATVDRCLDWLFDHGIAWVQTTIHRGVAEVAWGSSEHDDTATGPTLHAALVAACRAVQDGEP